MYRIRLAVITTLCLLTFTLSACASAPASTAGTTTPTASTAPSPTRPRASPLPRATQQLPIPMPSTPIPPSPVVATATLAPAQSSLPAPVYMISDQNPSNQIVRLDPDGVTLTQLTFELQPVQSFTVAAEAGTLAYLVGDAEERTLVVLDGDGRRELISGSLYRPTISPDGQMVLVRIEHTTPNSLASGVWVVATNGGAPSLVQADDPLESGVFAEVAAWVYTPIGYDPKGIRMLLWAYDAAGPAIPGGEVVILDPRGGVALRSATCCEDPAWSSDGQAITITGGGPGPDLRYGLYLIDAQTGEELPLIAQNEDSLPLVTGARLLDDGEVYAFYEDVPWESFHWEYPFRPQMARMSVGRLPTVLRADDYPLSDVLWRKDASGALLTVWDQVLDNPLAGRLVWLDAQGDAAFEIPLVGSMAQWADTTQALTAGTCRFLPNIGWQPAETRSFSTGAADLQARLNARGFDAGQADGYFGDQTRTALHLFQVGQGLSVTDTLDCATWHALLDR